MTQTYWIHAYDQPTARTIRFAVRAVNARGAVRIARDVLSKSRTDWTELELESDGRQVAVYDR